MCEVYKHARFTIYAASAAHSQEGFLNNYWPEMKRIIIFESKGSDESRSITRSEARKFPLHDYCPPSRFKSPIELRAWTMQERHLSCRLIEFTSSEVIFTCRTGRSCECGQKLLDQPLILPGWALSKNTQKDHSARNRTSFRDYQAWQSSSQCRTPACTGFISLDSGHAPKIPRYSYDAYCGHLDKPAPGYTFTEPQLSPGLQSTVKSTEKL